ncbi:MAG: hypothetical protein JXL97_15725 [Bacteroidales bacterium]|nr:hypothetical protein [Bacteroidales bacterium]
MGLFDKVKNMVNKVTGGGATVTISMEGDSLKAPVKVNITAVVKDAPIEIKKVYLRFHSVEKINIPKKEVPNYQGTFDLNIEKEVFNRQEFVVAEAQTLEAGQTYNWSYDVTINDPQAMPTYFGKYVSHEWEFFAALDAKGNDPDSKWQAHKLA